MTYTVHSCIGMDGKSSVSRIARVVGAYTPDIVALQELDVDRPRTGEVDQAHSIARILEMEYHFHPAFTLAQEQYGNAVLSRYPLRLVHSACLPGRNGTEPRGAIWCAVDWNGVNIQIIATHLGLRPGERRVQVEALLADEWLGHTACRGPVIVCGDLNAGPRSYVCRQLARTVRDAQRELAQHRPVSTWFGRYPLKRIDHIFVSSAFSVMEVTVPRRRLTHVASDHLPVIADLSLHERS